MIKTLYKKFQPWAEKGSIYILSDLHLDDWDCKLMDCGWISTQEQIEKINSLVHKNDTFICLGDVGNAARINELKAGYKVLIMGNHDKRNVCQPFFDEVYEGPLFISDKILLSHERVFTSIDGKTPICYNFHGHNHDKTIIQFDEYHMNLAANVCNYTPLNLGKFIKRGLLSEIKNIHRQTIDAAIDKGK